MSKALKLNTSSEPEIPHLENNWTLAKRYKHQLLFCDISKIMINGCRLNAHQYEME